MSETTTGVKWELIRESNIIYESNRRLRVGVFDANWSAYEDGKLVTDNFAPDFATAKRDAERWILEREGRLPTPAPATATDGGGWIACSERLPENDDDVEVITRGYLGGSHWTAYNGNVTHWRPRPVDPHADAACLFSDRYRPTVEQARAAARHVAGCEACRAKLEAGGGA